jgi:hypothetical protein
MRLKERKASGSWTGGRSKPLRQGCGEPSFSIYKNSEWIRIRSAGEAIEGTLTRWVPEKKK